MKTLLSENEECLLYILSLVLQGAVAEEKTEKIPDSANWPEIFDIARNHAVLSFLYDVSEWGCLTDEECRTVVSAGRKTVQQSYRLLFLSKYLISLLEKDGIKSILLKGAATAECYPVPELRKSGDVDLLLCQPEEINRAQAVMKKAGFKVTEKQLANHHVVFESPEGIKVEIHVMLAEPFDNHRINKYLEEIQHGIETQRIQKEIMGIKLPILADGYHAFELLLHMLQHYLRSGFGLKLLCDWVVFWNRNISGEQVEIYRNLVKESGLAGFSDMITSLCIFYLGLNKDKAVFFSLMEPESSQEFMQEILEAEEFGRSSVERMVTLRGNTIKDYIREFHHQMQLNFPKAGKIWLCWPVLWVVTLCRFLYNNRRVRKTSTWKIMRKAGQRSRKMKKIRLFDKKS